jgi:murein hydrolase activator
MRSLALGLLLTLPSFAHAEDAPGAKRLADREQTLARYAQEKTQTARDQARVAYRLARRRQLGFVGDPERRLEEARAVDLALLAARRGAAEARAFSDELARVRQERAATSAVSVRQEPDEARPSFQRPVRGALVGASGLRVDPGTGVELRQDGVQLLARMNGAVLAPAAGKVSRVELLPQGGFAVVMDHGAGWTSLLAGLREVSVGVGQELPAGGGLGLAGRNLDGAAVIAFELWHGRSPVDPAAQLRRAR